MCVESVSTNQHIRHYFPLAMCGSADTSEGQCYKLLNGTFLTFSYLELNDSLYYGGPGDQNTALFKKTH